MKVTIIVPIYNSEKFLKECINSLINQTYQNIEIILINDGSTDESKKIAQEYTIKDKRIKFIQQENCGVNIARKKGIDNSTGDYVMFVDADDWIEKNAIEILVSKLKKYNSDIIRFRYIIKPDNIKQRILLENKEISFEKEKKKNFYKFLIEEGQVHTLWGQIINKKLFYNKIEALDCSLCRSEDLWTNLDLYTYAKKITFIQDILYNYRNNNNSITRKIEKEQIVDNIKSIGFVYDKLFDYINKWNINDESTRKKVAIKQLHALCYETMKLLYVPNTKPKELKEIYSVYFETKNMEKVRKVLKETGISEVKLKNRIYYKLILNKKYNVVISCKLIIRLINKRK